MIEKRALSLPVEFQLSKAYMQGLKSARFEVTEGEILKFYADIVDAINTPQKNGAIYVIRFFNKSAKLIDIPYVGTSFAKDYGRVCYTYSFPEKEARVRYFSKFIVAPIGATILEITVYPFEKPKRIRLLGDIHCFALPTEPTFQHYCVLEAGQQSEQDDEVFPFWNSLFSFIIEKNQITSADVRVEVVFIGRDEQAIDMNTSVCIPMIGKRELHENGILIIPENTQVYDKHDEGGIQQLKALIQIIPPKNAIKAIVKVSNQTQTEAITVLYKIYKFGNLIESRFEFNDFTFEGEGTQLSYDVADITFLGLLSKRSRNVAVLEVALGFYSRFGTLNRILSIAKHILNVTNNSKLYSKARLALSEVRASAPSWFPSPGKVEVNESAEDKQLTVAHFMSTPDLDRICQKQDAEHVRAIAIMPLGYPKKGESGEPWERSEEEGVDCFFLNCVSAEQLELVPVTSQLNFMAVLAKDILRQEHVDLIHIHEDEASINSLLVGVALAKAFKIPLVYQKHTVVDEVVTEFDETKHSLAQAKLAREYQCMQIADAVIVQSETQRDALIKAGVQQQKISILPLTEDVAKGYTDVYELAQQTHLNKN